MIPLLTGAFLAGLIGSPHCVAMCGPFAASCTRTRSGLSLWHLGRLSGYAMLGALAGGFGAAIPGPAWLPAAIGAALLLWFAAALAGLAPEPRLFLPRFARVAIELARQPSPGSQLLFGVANGFLPCGLVYSALSIPVALRSPLAGALAMVIFGLGTVPAVSVAALGLRRIAMQSRSARRLLALLVLLAGLWSISLRAGLLPGDHSHHMRPTSDGR